MDYVSELFVGDKFPVQQKIASHFLGVRKWEAAQKLV